MAGERRRAAEQFRRAVQSIARNGSVTAVSGETARTGGASFVSMIVEGYLDGRAILSGGLWQEAGWVTFS